MNAFPQVNFRYIIIPRESLSPTFIFTQGAIASLIDAGTKDGQYYA